MVMCLLFYSCHSADSQPATSFNGEELFAGIFFGQGEVLDHIPQLKERQELTKLLKSDEELNEYREVQKNIIATLKNQNPDFFREFESKIESGDHVKITEAIQSASRSIVNAVNQYYGLQQEQISTISSELDKRTDIKKIILKGGEIDKKSIEPELNSILVGYLDTNIQGDHSADRQTCTVGPIAIAIAAVLVAVITIAAVFVDVYPSESTAAPSSLLSEQVVQSIATNLAVE